MCTPAGYAAGYLDSPLPLQLDHRGPHLHVLLRALPVGVRADPEQFAGHTSIIDRLLGGVIQPPTIPGALAYMGLSPEECGQDGTNYDWAHATAPVTAGPAASGAA